MNIQIYAKDIELTDGLKTYINETLSPVLEEFQLNDAKVTLDVRHKDHIANIDLRYLNEDIHTSKRSDDMYKSIHQLKNGLETILRQTSDKQKR